VVSSDGLGWDLLLGSDVMIDPVTLSVMLRPLCTKPEWASTTSGAYARLAKTDYTLVTPTAWVENPRKVAGDIYLESRGVNELVRTTATWPVNRPFFLSFYVFGTGSENAVALECGWGPPGDPGSVDLRVSKGGEVEVYKSGEKVGVYSVDNGRSLPLGSWRTGKSQKLAQQTIDLLLIPCRSRDLLVTSNLGGGFCHTFTDLPQTGPTTTNTITPASYFWWSVPAGKASVQCAPMMFAESGTVFGPETALRYAPNAPRTFGFLRASHPAGYGTQAAASSLVKASDLTAYTPDGVTTDVRLKVDLTGDGESTVFLYAVDAVMPRTVTTTADTPFDLMPHVTELELEVPEDGPATMQFAAYNPAALAAAGMDRPEELQERPVRLAVDPGGEADLVDVFRGTTVEFPVVTIGKGRGYQKARHIWWDCEDREREFELFSFIDTVPFDGLALTDVMEDLVTMPGFDVADTDIDADTLEIPFSPGVSSGDWQYIPERGDNVAGWLKRLRDEFAATTLTGWAPTAAGYKWRYKDPALLPTSPNMNLYQSTADAQAAGLTSDFWRQRTVRGLRQITRGTEANQVLVVGYDPRTRRHIPRQFNDAASLNPTLSGAARPRNWQGRRNTYQLLEPRISTDAAAERARDILGERLTEVRDLWEMQSDFLIIYPSGVPIWKGDVLRIYQKGSTTEEWARFRVLALRMRVVSHAEGRAPVREAEYLLRRLPVPDGGWDDEEDEEDEEGEGEVEGGEV
jgi:hypothetical protein